MKRLTCIAVLFAFSLSGCDNNHTHVDKHQHEEENHASTQQHSEDEAVEHDVKSHETDNNHPEENHETPNIRQTDSHLHGNATLAIALDDENLVIEFESPLYNLVGFEHEPSSDEEVKQLQQVESILSEPAKLFVFNEAAKCMPLKVEQNVSLYSEESEHLDEEDHHDSDDHDDEHSEALIEYMFKCAEPNKLTHVTTELFGLFPKLTELESVYLGTTTQQQTVLKPNNKQFNFSK